jgi:hypothetical protein
MTQPEFKIINQVEFNVNIEAEKDFEKVYGENSEEEIYV